jgi:hypothetical protein
MNKIEFEEWVLKYCPEDLDIDDFVDFLAVGSIHLVEHVSKETKKPIRELIRDFIPSDMQSPKGH